MNGYLIVRGIFVAVVVYAAVMIRPIAGPSILSGGLGLAIALLIVIAETRLRDAAVTNLLGGLLGFGVGLAIAIALGKALFWVDTTHTGVRFLLGALIIALPYLGLVLGARKGEW